jgi:hypothetical protein
MAGAVASAVTPILMQAGTSVLTGLVPSAIEAGGNLLKGVANGISGLFSLAGPGGVSEDAKTLAPVAAVFNKIGHEDDPTPLMRAFAEAMVETSKKADESEDDKKDKKGDGSPFDNIHSWIEARGAGQGSAGDDAKATEDKGDGESSGKASAGADDPEVYSQLIKIMDVVKQEKKTKGDAAFTKEYQDKCKALDEKKETKGCDNTFDAAAEGMLKLSMLKRSRGLTRDR